MDNPSLTDRAAAVMTALLLILTALGNAWLMLISGALALGLSLLSLRRGGVRGAALPAATAAAVAIAIAAATMIWLR